MIRKWSQLSLSNKIAIAALIVAIIGVIAALVVIPQVQQLFNQGNPFSAAPTDTEIQLAVDNYEFYTPVDFQVLGKEKCSLISGDASNGISEKWFVRANYQLPGYPSYERAMLIVNKNGKWEYYGLWNNCPT